MNKKMVYGILMLFLLSLPFLLSNSNINYQNNQKTGINSPATLNNSAVTVTHPSDLVLNYGDPTNQTISWTLNESGSRDYLGTFSFKSDADGSVPSGWTRPYNASNTDGKIVGEKVGHRKVIEMYDNNPDTGGNGYTVLRTTFSAQITGTVEWWCYGVNAGPDSNLQFLIYGTPNGVYLVYNMADATLRYYDGSWHTICGLSNEVWHHFRLKFNCTSDTFNLWVDGTLQIANAMFTNPQTSLTALDLYTGGASTGGYYIYFDAFDFSWTPGYYLNRNMQLENSTTKDYLGLYSFTTDSTGGTPAGWTSTGSVSVRDSYNGHRKVVDLMNGGKVTNFYSNKPTGTVEYWWAISDATKISEQFLYGSVGPSCTVYLYFENGNFHCYTDYPTGNLHTICPGSSNTWYHIKITWTGSSWTVAIGNTTYGPYNFYCALGTGIGETWLDSYDSATPHVYIDAVDYSWAPGYYTNRNMNYATSLCNLTYAIFDDGIPKTSWQPWSGNFIVNYSVSGTSLDCSIHNISLVFRDDTGKWLHDDVLVTVQDAEDPKFLEVVQNPVTPGYQQAVNVTAHITDNDGIQTVLIETNYTGTGPGDYLGTYSFTNDADGSVPSGWTRPYHAINTDGKIIGEKAGHRKVIALYDNNPDTTGNGYTVLRNAFSPQTTGTVEFWFYGNTTAQSYGGHQFLIVGASNFIYLFMNTSTEELFYYDGTWHKICNLANEMWHHFRVQFDCGSDSFNVWVDGALRATGCSFTGPETSLNLIDLYTGGSSTGGFYVYFDAFDYSWAPGYYLNRNMISSGYVNYSMALLSGSQNDGVWGYTFNSYPTNKSISYRILAQDTSGNWNTTDYFSFEYFDTVGPNIASVTQVPSEPPYLGVVNVTAHITDATQVQTVSIETNYTGPLSTYPMTLLSGSLQDGVWKYSFGIYPVNKSIFYRITASDVLGNQNSTDYYAFGYYDILCPNIVSILQAPLGPSYLDIVNVTVHITDVTLVQAVTIETNYTGTLSTYPMTLLSGSLQDGVWKYSFGIYPVNKSIFYRIITSDILGNQNSTGYYGFGYFDFLAPNIISIIQVPSTPTYLDIVNVTAHITDATLVQKVSIQTNYTGTLSTYPMSLTSGSASDGVWKYVFNNYPLNAVITYFISTQDIFGNSNSSAQSSFGVFDLIDPTLLNVVQTPATLTRWDSVQVTTHVQENFALGSVMINSNHTGSWANYPMVLLNGSLQDGFWGFTVINYPYNKSIWYRVSAIDVVGRTTTTGYSQFGIYPIVSNHVPLNLEIDVDVGMAGNRKADITFTFQNTGNTNLVNINFTIHLPIGWRANTLVRSVSQLAPGQTVTITFKITVPSNVSEFLELVLIDVNARISELGMDWPTQSIEVVVSGVKVWDLFIWLIIIVGSCSAAVATRYVYIHKRSVGQKALSTKVKGKTTVAITNALSTDIPGSLSAVSMEVMEKIENLPGITNDEKLLIIQFISQLDEEDAIKYLDEMKNTQMD